jgi:hypothetical protein
MRRTGRMRRIAPPDIRQPYRRPVKDFAYSRSGRYGAGRLVSLARSVLGV